MRFRYALNEDSDSLVTRGLPMATLTSIDRASIRLGWFTFLCAPVALVIGHMGSSFKWKTRWISEYAAYAPNDDWVTTAMILGIVAILCLALQIAKRLRPLWWTLPIALLLCVAAGGLGTLAYYELGPTSVLHYRGLQVLIFAAPGALFLSGMTLSITRRRWAGLIVSSLSVLGVVVYHLDWVMLRLDFGTFRYKGISQRGAFLCLWLAAMGLLWLVSRRPAPETTEAV